LETISHLFSFLRARPETELLDDPSQARKDEVIDKFARAVVARRLEAPAALFLELNRPLGFLFSQATFFARPFLGFFLPVRDIEAAAEVLDDPTSLERILDRIGELSAEGSPH
jgi:hypothetical protein